MALAGWGLTFPLMGPVVRSAHHGFMLRFPIAMTIATFLAVQASNWQRPCKTFHEIMAQPAPHGTYLRRTIKVRSKRTYCNYRNTSQSGGTKSVKTYTLMDIHYLK